MALLAINLADGLFDQIRALVTAGKYVSPEAFLEIAAFNQLALERGSSPSEIVSQGHRASPPPAHEPGAGLRKVLNTEESPPVVRKASGASTSMRVPKQVYVLESRANSIESVLRPFRLPATDGGHPSLADQHICTDRVFGQVNRLFPLKLVCRWLHREVVDGQATTWPLYSSVSDSLGDSTAQLGSLLESWDQIAGRKRDDQWGTGLPRKGNSASRDRFLSQFVARITRATELVPGAIYQYQLATFDEGQIQLTPSGIDFAKLTNPVLDQTGATNVSILADDEARFLAKQVRTWAAGEAEDMRVVLRAVVGGIVAPSDVLAKVQSAFPPEWTESVLTTHVGGVIARLCELQLIKRYWHGRHVEYRIAANNRVAEFIEPGHEDQ